jgi:subtilisin family serine protease
MVGIRPLALVFLMVAFALPESASAATRIIVQRDAGLSAAERSDIREDAGVRLVETLDIPRTEVVAAPAADTTQALRDLRADDDVVYAEIDRRRSVHADPYMAWLWGLNNTGQNIFQPGLADSDIDGVEAWQLQASPDVPISGAGVTVAVVDSGIDADHEDLDTQIAATRNFIGSDPTATTDGTGHGTHVAGTIAAIRDNSVGIVGVAPESKIMALRVIGNDGSGYDSDIAEAFDYAGDEGIRVVNASLGGAGSSHTLDIAISQHPNTLYVVSAGNGGADDIGDDNDVDPIWPCDSPEPNVICVGASDNRDERGEFSNYGDETVDLFAPGVSVLSTIPLDTVPGLETQKYAFYDGTSQAAPHVAGTAALMLQANPSLSARQLKDVLIDTADDKPAFEGYSVSGGRLNAAVAVSYVLENGIPLDSDGDGVVDAADSCPQVAAPGQSNGCPLDRDSDGQPDATDNCDLNANPTQADADHDGIGDACDPTPRGPDVDRDGKGSLDDRCPTVYGTDRYGCPITNPASLDRDHDGRNDASDGCPTEPASTNDGCPLPALTALSAKSRKHRASITVRTSRAATVRITVQRKKGQRWVRVARTTVATSPTNRARLRTKRLRAGRYRAVVVLSSSAGRVPAQSKRFRVR